MKAFTIFTIFIAILIILQIFDLYTSIVNIENKNLMEANPINRYILNNYGVVAYSVVKILLYPLIFLMIFIYARRNQKDFKPWFNIIVLMVVLVYVGTVIWNLLLP